jgi:hypothetical protein
MPAAVTSLLRIDGTTRDNDPSNPSVFLSAPADVAPERWFS